LYYHNNPMYEYIEKYFNNSWKQYREFQHKVYRLFANKIGTWYLECKYNPKYEACKKRLKLEYEEMYEVKA